MYRYIHLALARISGCQCMSNTGEFFASLYDRCGKTTLCHLFASLLGRDLSSINCHMHTEAADFLGGLRPVRTRTDTDVSDLN